MWFNKYAKAEIAIRKMIIVAVLCLVGILGLALGTAAFGFQWEGEASPYGDNGIGSLPKGSKGCYLKDDAFEGVTSPIQNSDQVLEKIGSSNKKKLEKNKAQLDSLIAKALTPENNINPALLIAIWGGESTFDNDGKALGCAVFSGVNPDYSAKATKNFDSQVDCAISQGIKKAMEKRAPYDAPQNQNTFTRLFFNYTGAMKSTYQKYGYVANSDNSRIKILNTLVPDQVTCDASPLDNKNKFKDLEQVKAYYGTTPEEIEKHLTTSKDAVTFMGFPVIVNKDMTEDLKKVEAALKKQANFKITSVGGYGFRSNVNDPGNISSHAFGLAIDLNATENPNGGDRSAGSKKGDAAGCMPKKIENATVTAAVAKAFTDNNFFWGAEFQNVCDRMHFQYGGNWN